MMPEIGQIVLILALLCATVQMIVPLYGAWQNDARMIAVAIPAARVSAFFVLLAFLILTNAFLQQDFSVAYVAQNSNSLLPIKYRYSAVWGAHEGSLLLWVLILSIWTVAVSYFSSALSDRFRARVLGILGSVSVGFLSFLFFTSNPFLRHLPALADGNDLNPLLQDPGLIIHPPMLYTGYVGLSVAFAFAVACLLEGRMERAWLQWSRAFTQIAWSFLTLGIALGSWWAYYELGWGGWWFWDPVENASFMPWIVGTALLHAQAITDKRGAYRAWTLLLSIIAFSLSLLGTFLVRSGVLTSVHAFASDPTRGNFVLTFLAIMCGGALTLFAFRGARLQSTESVTLGSRGGLMLFGNVLLLVCSLSILFGTVAPLLTEAFGLPKFSLGAPWFGFMFSMIMAPVFALLPFGPLTRWLDTNPSAAWKKLRPALVATLVVGSIYLWRVGGIKATLGIIAASWVLLGTAIFIAERMQVPAAHKRFTVDMLAMLTAHVGVAVFLVGVTLTNALSVEKDLAMARGSEQSVAGLRFKFNGIENADGPNYGAARGTIVVMKGAEIVATLHPEKRGYGGGQVMTESAIIPGLFRDIYVALGEPIDEQGGWALRIYVKPFIRWIWLGALLMMCGGFLAALGRLRVARVKTTSLADGVIDAA
jgi:cytochrome c-type biogenesis protein CcmF